VGRFHHLAAACVVVAVAAAPAYAADFLKAIEDVPLIAGMTEQAEPVVFESDQGRVVKTIAEGHVDAARISSFYVETLPSLGWKRTADTDSLSFERENERLNIAIRQPASSRPIAIQFELIVKLASTRLPE
jgi:hypothetical protein